MSIILPITPQTIGPVTALNLIKVIEQLGGSKGYLEHLRGANSIDKISQPLSLLSVSDALSASTGSAKQYYNCYIHLQSGCIPGLLVGWIKVFNQEGDGPAAVQYATQIRTWVTQGLGYVDLHGTFVGPSDWDEMLKRPTKFTIVAAEGKGLHATFRLDYLPSAEISADFPEATGVVKGAFDCEGNCQWEEIVY